MSTTAHQDSVLRLSLGMLAADPRAALEPEDRTWIADRLQHVDGAGLHVPFTAVERALVREPLLAYVQAHYPRILDIVTRQFTQHGAGEGPQGTQPRRPSDHYGLVPRRTQA